jgi:hypothetical protein
MFNARLLNEYHGLAALAERASLPERMVPRPVFLGTHGGLAVVAESMLPGSPFPLHSSGQADCPTAARAIEGIGRLAAATARPATGADHAKAIADLVAHLREIYRPDAELLGSVEEALGALARAGTVPTVFLHGDPGDWNLLVAPDGEIGFLDWENSETEGPPLWDLFWFVHSYAGFAAERSGIRATPAACARRLLEPTAEAEAMVRATRGLALRLGVDVAAIEPLFVLHAVAMAVREAWRLPPEDPGRGRCFGWLREVVARRASSPILARLRSTD